MKKGFTLIELLIVIAIIAILALIAVPNFLEAQVRAKISRVHADMRTVAVGIKAYAVDWGREPIGRNESRSLGITTTPTRSWCMHVLTTPVAFLGSLFFISAFFNGIDSDFYATPLFHLFSGGAMLAAFFIATDPVTAATTNKGKIYYGIGIGALTYIIRTWGGYPDGVAFAVLIMNMVVPTIDYYTQPRVFGQERD